VRRFPYRSRPALIRGVALFLAAFVIVAQIPGALAASRKTAPKLAQKPVMGLAADVSPANPFFIIVKQPNGKAVRTKLTGAEIGGHLETSDGYTIVKGKNGYWYYGARAEGAKVFPSSRRAGIDSPAGLTKGLGRVPSIWSGKYGNLRDQTFRMLQVANYQAQMQAATTGVLPRVFKVPFIMIATYWDPALGQTGPSFLPGHDKEFFTKLLDGYGGNPTGTMTEFWLENSYGQLKVDVDVYGPYTSYRSVIDRCYYGNVEAENQTHQINPLNRGPLPVALPGGNPNDPIVAPAVGAIPRVDDLDPAGNFLGVGGLGAVGMAIEAVPQADKDINFADYDNNGDGYVDFTGFIHSGPDMAATGDPCMTWSHMNTVSFISGLAAGASGISALDPYKVGVPTTDIGATGLPVMVDRVLTVPEVNLDIGVAVHEMMHALGEPDYYNTSYTSMGTGDWDIMAGGSWFGMPPGSNPIGANPATKVFQGWVQPKVIHGDVRNIALRPREFVPMKGYNGTKVDPNLLLIPIAWTDSTAPADVYGLAKDPANGKYITEGWYIENLSRSASGPADLTGFKRSPYFERLALSSGILVWHFDYYKKSNVFYAANDANSDPNRPQMDPEEFDFNDNSQELQLNLTRGEPSDLWYGAATGMTSATRQVEVGVPSTTGVPDKPLGGTGVLLPVGTVDYDFKVSNSPGNYQMDATVVGTGDCTLTLFYKEGGNWVKAGSSDTGFVGEQEEIKIFQPKPGDWRLEVGNFLLCLQHTWAVNFSVPFSTRGAADTWTNERLKTDGSSSPGTPTGWAITNIGPHLVDGWEHSADAGGSSIITLDIINLDKNEVDVSPGFVKTAEGKAHGLLPLNVGKATTLEVPVYNNGGKMVHDVAVRVATADGHVIGSETIASIGGYSRATAHIAWTPTVEGPTALLAAVDPANTIAEVHEGNNVQKTTLMVGPANPRVLVVDDDGAFDANDTYFGVLTALGVPFSVAGLHADAALMKQYKAVIWEAGLDRYQGQLNIDDRNAIRSYLNGGGKFWYLSPRAADALGEAAGRTNPGGGTTEMIGLLRDYFGAEWIDTLQVGGGMVKGVGDAIGAKLSFNTDVFPGRPLQDVFQPATSGIGTATKILDWAKGPAMGMKVVGNAAHKNFRAVYFGFNLSQVIDGPTQVALARQVMTWLGVAQGTYTPAVPLIYHTQIRTRVAKQESPLSVYAFGTGVPSVFYRSHDRTLWSEAVMKTTGVAGLYTYTIPGAFSTLRGMDYFVKAGSVADPVSGPSVVHFVSAAPPEVAPPAVAGKKIVRQIAKGGSHLPATGVGSGLVGIIPIGLALALGVWVRRRRTA
jgi:M6 family metalloprotease-like protein